MVDLFATPLSLTLEMDQLPKIVRVNIFGAARPDLDLRDGNQNLIPNYFNLCRVRFALKKRTMFTMESHDNDHILQNAL